MKIQIKENNTGYLLPFYLDENIIGIKRFFILKNKKAGDIRGNHAHKKDFQKLLLLNGEAEVEFENKDQKSKINLEFGKIYHSKPYEWLNIHMIKENTIILVFSTEKYDEDEYIRDYDKFMKFIKGEQSHD